MSSTSVETRVGQVVWHDHVSTDPEAAKRFYGKLLGWEFKLWEGGDRPYSMIRSGGSEHGGFIGVEDASVQAHWGPYVVAEVDAAVERAREAGGTVHVEPNDIPEVGRFGVVSDQHGAIIAPFAPSYDSPAPQGVFMWDELLTPDVEGAKAFYNTVLGWGSRDMDMGEMGTYTIFTRADGEDVGGAMQPQGSPGPARWQSYLAADDVDASTKRAAELGAIVQLEPVTIEGVGRLSVLTDPTGAAFGLLGSPE
jgi:uncharacterized protein